MNIKRSPILFLTAIFIAVSPACSSVSEFTATATPEPTSTSVPTASLAPTSTPVPTRTPLPTASPTADPSEARLSTLPQAPAGFTWKLVDDLDVAFMMPDDWYFNRQHCPVMNVIGSFIVLAEDVGQACISREDPRKVSKYSTGQAVLMYDNIDDPDGLAEYILYILANTSDFGFFFIKNPNVQTTFEYSPELYTRDEHVTKKVIGIKEDKVDKTTIRHLRVEAEYPNETEGNRFKTIQYSTIPINNRVYLMIFETPSDLWDEILQKYDIVLWQLNILME
jgi:hypothetical protein